MPGRRRSVLLAPLALLAACGGPILANPVPPEKHYPGVDRRLAAIAMRAMSKSRDARF